MERIRSIEPIMMCVGVCMGVCACMCMCNCVRWRREGRKIELVRTRCDGSRKECVRKGIQGRAPDRMTSHTRCTLYKIQLSNSIAA